MDESNMSFPRSVLSGSDGSGSATRICMVALVSFVIGIGASLTYRIHQPLTVDDLNNFLSAAGIFLTTTCSPLYLINRGADVLQRNNNVELTKGGG